MKVEVRSLTSMKLIPESDSDRAVVTHFAALSNDKMHVLYIQSTCWGDSKIQEVVFGYDKLPSAVPDAALRSALASAVPDDR